MGTGRKVRRVATGALLAAGAAVLAGGYVLRRPVPRGKGKVTLQGLRARAEIIRDRWGVPHIYATNIEDVAFAVGYAQAQDRLWQMEVNRRAASGTLSELLGEQALEIDRMTRRIGFRRAAERDWREADKEERAALNAYAAGVNAYIARAKMPLEFTILRSRPGPWQPVDSLAFGRLFGWALTGNWDSEIVRSWTIERFGAEVMAELEPNYPAGAPVIVPPGTEAKGIRPDLLDDMRQTEELVGFVGRGASNNWAVDGTKSATGKPLLASDPHLTLSMPSIWWEMHIDSPEMKAAGVGLPGLPAVIMGHNERIAWGMTAALVDGDDLFVEQVDPADAPRYRQNGKWSRGEVVREEIAVRKRKEPVVEEVLTTRHGPVISPAIKGETRTLALRTVALEPAHQVKAMMTVMAAQNWDEFRQALQGWPFPSLNFAYADVDGNIGYQLAGLVPMRGKGHGTVPAPGWTEDYDWKGFVPFDELPHSYNPPAHWIASANNKIADDDYPHFLSTENADGFRQKRIVEMLEAKEKHSTADFERMQVDQLSLAAKELVPLVTELKPEDEWCRRVITFLKAWDYRLSPDSVAACVYEVFFAHMVRRTLEEKLGSWSDFFLGKGVHALRPHTLFYVASHSWLMEKMRERPEWFQGKTWSQAMEEALGSAVAELRERLGDEVSRWQWGRLHKQPFAHALGGVRGLDRIFNRAAVPVGGDANTVWQAAYTPYNGYDVNSFTASWRQIIDLADFNESRATLPSGQSGHPGSRHYADMTGMWRRGAYHPMLWDREQVEAGAKRRLELSPS
ncbi:MAG TPA: penicillin acylase family protein [Dehalococcoidia bacterium]|nr:penicillin acylase family protein [Dehalococcoidia bacterium]